MRAFIFPAQNGRNCLVEWIGLKHGYESMQMCKKVFLRTIGKIRS
jgi:hypothetical protein